MEVEDGWPTERVQRRTSDASRAAAGCGLALPPPWPPLRCVHVDAQAGPWMSRNVMQTVRLTRCKFRHRLCSGPRMEDLPTTWDGESDCRRRPVALPAGDGVRGSFAARVLRQAQSGRYPGCAGHRQQMQRPVYEIRALARLSAPGASRPLVSSLGSAARPDPIENRNHARLQASGFGMGLQNLLGHGTFRSWGPHGAGAAVHRNPGPRRRAPSAHRRNGGGHVHAARSFVLGTAMFCLGSARPLVRCAGAGISSRLKAGLVGRGQRAVKLDER